MRIIHIAAGAGGMYCGACARDLNMVRGLINRGHEVEVVPLYTPLRMEGRHALPLSPLFYGGVSVYLAQLSPIFHRLPSLLRQWLDHPRLLAWLANFAIDTDPRHLGAMTNSVLAGCEGKQRQALDSLLDYLANEARPDVLSITNSMLSGIAPAVKERLGIPVVCALQGEDSFIDAMSGVEAARARRQIQHNAAAIDLFIATTGHYADRMAEYLAVPRERIRVVRPGISAEEYPRVSARATSPFTVGYLSVITPGKGLDLLVTAVKSLVVEGRDIRLRIAGKVLNRHYWRTLARELTAAPLRGRVEVLDEVDFAGKQALFASSSVFVLPSRFAEARGMVALEAMARGIPVIVPDHGVFTEIIAATGGGLLTPPGDADALARAIATLQDDPPRADALGIAGASGVRAQFSTEVLAREAEEVFLSLARPLSVA